MNISKAYSSILCRMAEWGSVGIAVMDWGSSISSGLILFRIKSKH
jgi:hypothetical protein